MGPHGMGFPNNGFDDQGWKMYITAVVMIILAGLFVIARCATRMWMLGKLGWDDFTIVVALVSVLKIPLIAGWRDQARTNCRSLESSGLLRRPLHDDVPRH
jgi:hypothetical protein